MQQGVSDVHWWHPKHHSFLLTVFERTDFGYIVGTNSVGQKTGDVFHSQDQEVISSHQLNKFHTNQSKVRCSGGVLATLVAAGKAILVPPLSVPQGESIQMGATVRSLCPCFKPAACKLQSRSHVTTLAPTVPAGERWTPAQGCAVTGSHHPSEEGHIRAAPRVCWVQSTTGPTSVPLDKLIIH